ncbi:transposable element Tcb1 transposase [Trichonephila clavipes]|nr:transposable element Tcb1 transposase [Trichonephila clavipes]
MSAHGNGRLHIVSKTVKSMDYIEIPQNKLLPTARDLLGNQSWIFQDDNAPCYRAKLVQNWLEDHTVNRMNWPGQSPDLNPIESLWFKIGYEISKKKPSNKRELIEALIFSFNDIVTKHLLLKLVHFMPKRCRACHLLFPSHSSNSYAHTHERSMCVGSLPVVRRSRMRNDRRRHIGKDEKQDDDAS